MTSNMIQTLDQILDGLKFIRATTGLKVSDDILWDSGVRIFNSQGMKEVKASSDLRQKREHETYKESEPATQKQIEFLLRNKISFNAEKITKKEAHEIISKLKAKDNTI